MLAFLRIIIIVYLAAINLYSFLLLKTQKTKTDEGDKCAIKDGKLFIAALLGGALGVYIAMFALKYRMTSLFLMVTMPVLITLNVYIVIMCFARNFGIVVETPSL